MPAKCYPTRRRLTGPSRWLLWRPIDTPRSTGPSRPAIQQPKSIVAASSILRGDLSNPWWTAFLARPSQITPPVGLDGVHIHTYPVTGSAGTIKAISAAQIRRLALHWWDCLENALRHYFLGQHECATPQCDLTRGKPLLVTEYGYLGVYQGFPAAAIEDVRDDLMQPVLTWLIDPSLN